MELLPAVEFGGDVSEPVYRYLTAGAKLVRAETCSISLTKIGRRTGAGRLLGRPHNATRPKRPPCATPTLRRDLWRASPDALDVTSGPTPALRVAVLSEWPEPGRRESDIPLVWMRPGEAPCFAESQPSEDQAPPALVSEMHPNTSLHLPIPGATHDQKVTIVKACHLLHRPPASTKPLLSSAS